MGDATDHAPVEPIAVLVVEDQPDSREMFAMLLEEDGHRVTGVGTGRACLAALRGGGFDLALIDIGLPDLTGFEVARAARAEIDRLPWMVALSGYAGEEDVRLAEEAGFDDHIAKPMPRGALAAAVEAARAHAEGRGEAP